MSALSELDALILREAVHPPLITKNAELTFAEWDAHVTAMYDAIQSMVSGDNVTPYNPLTVYDAASTDVYLKFAGYDSRIWEAIGTFSDVTPAEGINWTQVTMAELLPDVLKLAQISGGGGGGGTLDQAYDNGGAGLGRTIIADTGAVKIEGADGLLVTGVFGTGAASEWVGGGAYDSGMFFNPKKAAFRAGIANGAQWDDANVGVDSFAAGEDNIASGLVSFAIGIGNTASGSLATAIGEGGTASGEISTVIGNVVNAKSFAELSVGTFNTDYTPTDAEGWSATDRLFGIGNGADAANLSDAFVVLKSGKITCPSTTGSFTPNVLTTAERDALTATAGMLIYNSTTDKLQCYDGTIWNDLY